MKLTFADISGFLKAPDKAARAVLIYGPDEGLISERMKIVGRAVVADLNDPFNVKELSEAAVLEDPAVLFDELSAMSLMGGRRLVLLRDAGDKLAKTVEEATAKASGDTYLIVTAGEMTPKSSLRMLFEREPHLAALPCYHDEGKSLAALIASTLKGAGIRFSPDVAAYLNDRLGGDRRATVSELEKILTYLGDEKELKLEAAMALTGHADDLTTDDLCEAVAGGHFAGMEDTLTRLLREGTPAPVALRAAMRYFQRLAFVQERVASGMTEEEALAQLRPPVFFKQLPGFKRHLSLWRGDRLARALAAMLMAERDAKSGQFPPDLLCRKVLLDTARLAGR